ncbi:hypothetical protein HU200_011058 [Digitaria exilis]|uniref:Reverse transcriptase zinc-binding domain-containing protein n=1 Tax=Digitaria exilis TaxID=1010633 RepID=A0A835FIX3_9POAL|nr:hypothetical protein HU200_011058 [Digitaria exilis]
MACEAVAYVSIHTTVRTQEALSVGCNDPSLPVHPGQVDHIACGESNMMTRRTVGKRVGYGSTGVPAASQSQRIALIELDDHRSDTPCWRDIKKLIPEYRAITTAAIGDGDSTSFWHDTWSEASILRDALPALYSHCTDTDLTVAKVVLAGGLDSALQPRLSSTAQAERELLVNALDDIELSDARDTRWIRGGPSSDIRAADIYNALRAPVGGPQWRGSTGNASRRRRTCASLHRHGARDPPDCPFCPGVAEEADHLFVTCPRLADLWSWAVAAICSTFAAPAKAAHTSAMGVLWIIWKARNAMVFRNLQEDAPTMARHLQQHIELWVCRAPPRWLDIHSAGKSAVRGRHSAAGAVTDLKIVPSSSAAVSHAVHHGGPRVSASHSWPPSSLSDYVTARSVCPEFPVHPTPSRRRSTSLSSPLLSFSS